MSVEDKAPVKLSLPLDFQQQIFHELRKEDELLILARGLGLLRIVTNLLHSYDAAGNNLIMVVGAEDRENDWIGESLAEKAEISRMTGKCRGLTKVDSDRLTPQSRQKMYTNTGIFSVTSRILIVDFLSGLVDVSQVTGIVILHAERVKTRSVEAFIIRKYREENKKGFLKAFSDEPEAFASGFAPLSTMLKNLFLRKVALYPRFQVDVAKSLEGRKRTEVIELDVTMTESMRIIQNAILECTEASISELKKLNSSLETDDWNIDEALQRNFHQRIRAQLQPVMHRVSIRTRQILKDLGTLHDMLQYIMRLDAVSFQKYLDVVITEAQPPEGKKKENPSPWMLLDAADTLFETARRRVYTGKLGDGKDDSQTAKSNGLEALHPVLEELPKWELLADILAEIERDVYFNPVPQDDSSGAILVMCNDQATGVQIREYLQHMHVHIEETNEKEEGSDATVSAAFMMRRKLRNYIPWKRNLGKVSVSMDADKQTLHGDQSGSRGAGTTRGKAPANKRRRVRGASSAAAGPGREFDARAPGNKDAYINDLLASLAITEIEAQQKEEVVLDPLHKMEQFYSLYEMQDLLVVHPYNGEMDEFVLEEVKPRYVIMFEPEAAFIRRIEVYRSSHTDRNVKVYFMYYGGSVEEQGYLAAVRKEKDAFAKLIRERGHMTVTIDVANTNPEETFLRTINTRIAGGGRLAATAAKPRIVADMREFRASLTGLLHARSMDVIPAQLTVGDYILTPNICIERKSIPDLIGSFKSGRLYNQVETMLQHYTNPMLLIEFGDTKNFTLEPFSDLSHSAAAASMASPDLQSKIVILTIQFPRLRIVWSSSPYQTAEIFEDLKRQQEEPDPQTAVMLGLEDGEDAETGRVFNQDPMDMLRAIPGITEKNLVRISLRVSSIQELANMEEDEICGMVGREAGRQIWRFFNRDMVDD